jgi:hypothetical protein
VYSYRSPSRSSSTTRDGRARETPTRVATCCAAALLACASGCTETVLVRENASPMRLAEPARVYTLERGEWVESANRVDARGWYLVPPSMVEKP